MIVAAEPQLLVDDLDAALAFYRRLGFEPAFVYGEPPFYAQVRRDAARLNLRLTPTRRDDASGEADLLAATLAVEDAEDLFAEFDKAGVAFQQPLKTEPWGARTFTVADPAGNLLLFAA